jgi:hypothetical protein
MSSKKRNEVDPSIEHEAGPSENWAAREDGKVEHSAVPERWGSWDDAERWRRESFLRRTPAQRLRWLEEMLTLKYRRESGVLNAPTDPEDPPK